MSCKQSRPCMQDATSAISAFNAGSWSAVQKQRFCNAISDQVIQGFAPVAGSAGKRQRPNQTCLTFHNMLRVKDVTAIRKAPTSAAALRAAADLCDELELHLPSEKSTNHIVKVTLFLREELDSTSADTLYTLKETAFKDQLEIHKRAKYVAKPVHEYNTPLALPKRLFDAVYKDAQQVELKLWLDDNEDEFKRCSSACVPKDMRKNSNAIKASNKLNVDKTITIQRPKESCDAMSDMLPFMQMAMQGMKYMQAMQESNGMPSWLHINPLAGSRTERADASSEPPAAGSKQKQLMDSEPRLRGGSAASPTLPAPDALSGSATMEPPDSHQAQPPMTAEEQQALMAFGVQQRANGCNGKKNDDGKSGKAKAKAKAKAKGKAAKAASAKAKAETKAAPKPKAKPKAKAKAGATCKKRPSAALGCGKCRGKGCSKCRDPNFNGELISHETWLRRKSESTAA